MEPFAQALEQPCIRCGDCAVVCPVQLQPQRLLLHLRDADLVAMQRDRALDCTQCGRCDVVCPSRIPLMQRYREAKVLLEESARQRAAAMAARDRYRARQARLSRDDQAREERQSERAANATSADAVAAAIARAKARKAALRGAPKA